MDLDYTIISLINILAFSSGITLGILLLVIGKKKKKPILFLGLFIIAYTLELAITIITDLGITDYYPNLALLPFRSNITMVFLLYIYIKKVSVFSKKPLSNKILLPSILFFLIHVTIFFQNVETKQKITESLWFVYLYIGDILFSVIILLAALQLIKKHLSIIKNQYSAIAYKKLGWIKIYIYSILIFLVLIMGILPFSYDYCTVNIYVTLINIGLLYWIAIKGILQQTIPNLVPLTSHQSSQKTGKKNSSDSGSLPMERNAKETTELLNKLTHYIVSKEVYKQPDLTIIDLAEGINEHPKRVSVLINTTFNQNFNAYINGYRVKKAKMLLKSEQSNQFSIEGIGNESGFQNKGTFYKAFKKVTGITPLQYKNRYS